MTRFLACFSFFLIRIFPGLSQEETVLNGTLLRGDKLFINHRYAEAVDVYLKYLEKYPRDYYAERQTALCYNYLNKPDDAIDHWPIVVESSDATEKDYLEYGKSLLANNRIPEAKKVFVMLSKSKDKSIAAWGKTYVNPSILYIDSGATRIVEVNGINTDLSQSCPVSLNGKIFYVSELVRAPRLFYALGDEDTQHIGGALKKDSVHLLNTLIFEKLHILPIQGPFCFSPDGSLLYFCRPVSNRELLVKSDATFFKYQLYTLTMSTLNDEFPEIKPFRYNLSAYNFMHPAISADAKRLFFVSDMKGSRGGKDVFMCEWTSNGWGTPVNAGPEINSTGNEVYPFLAEDNVLYYSSDQLPGIGGLDIFAAQPSSTKDKLFEESENAGANINSRFDDFGVLISRGAHNGYFSSNRKNNTDDDIYFFYKIK